MCGIAGVLRLDGAPVDCRGIKAMTDALAHRGPDGEGQWCEGRVGLGHRRLAIIDLSSDAAQPMHSSDGRYVITYNGEVYNYKELRRALEKSGSRFRSHSDTEVVLEAVIRWGIEAAIRRFNGMFAFAIWDRHEQNLLLGRDRYGIKPLYLWRGTNQLALASEPKAFRSLPDFRPVLDPQGVAEYFTFQNILTERTFLRDVSVFPPGCWGQFDSRGGELRVHRYWDFDFHEPSRAEPDEEYARELNRLLDQAVHRQLVSDVEVGSYLSGGLDSGSIVALAARYLPGIKTFTVGFELDAVADHERHFDERPAAAAVVDFVDATHFEAVIGPRHVRECLPTLVCHLEEPRVGQSYPNFYAAELASESVKVVLAGTGGDEVLGGYPWRYPSENMSWIDFRHWHFGIWQRLLSDAQLEDFLSPMAEDLKQFDARGIHQAFLASDRVTPAHSEDPLAAALNFEARTFLPGLLAVEDRLSMAHGLEVRVPFLDNDFVDFCQFLPRRARLGGGETSNREVMRSGRTSSGKRLLRAAMRGLLPISVLEAAKQGFAGPDTMWFSRDLRNDVLALLGAFDTAIANRSVLEQLLTQDRDSPRLARLLSWSASASSLHLRDYWPSGNVAMVGRSHDL